MEEREKDFIPPSEPVIEKKKESKKSIEDLKEKFLKKGKRKAAEKLVAQDAFLAMPVVKKSKI
jgi:hypothetical protein